jgi:RNA polymerase sigma factor (sigma-70 family)
VGKIPPLAETASGSIGSNEVFDPEQDAAAVARHKIGDPQAFEELMRRYWAFAVRLACRMTNDWDLSEDVAQNAFARIWKKMDSVRSERSFQGMLIVAVTNGVRDHWKDIRTRTSESLESATEHPSSTKLDEILHNKMLQEIIESFIAKLPERRRRVILMKAWALELSSMQKSPRNSRRMSE